MRTLKSIKKTVVILLTTVTVASHAEYTPDTIVFPSSAPLVFDSAPILSLPDGGAIEFWVGTDWATNPGYHPVILANGSAESPIYQISITANQDALIVQSGQAFGQFSFNFADGRTHHVALLDYDEQMIAFVDGQLLGSIAMSIQSGPIREFVVGSASGGVAPFIGAVSAIRIWDVPPELEDTAGFALRDVNDTNTPHPNLDNLVGISDFRNRTFSIVDSLVLNESELMTRAEVIETLGETEVRALDLEFTTAVGETNE